MTIQTIILRDLTASGLQSQINKMVKGLGSTGLGWKPIGGHTAVTKHAQYRYRGAEVASIEYTTEYAQSMRREVHGD